MTAQLYRIDVFPRLAFHPENAPYVGTSYRLKATGQVDLERVKTVLSDPLAEVCALPHGVEVHGDHVLDVQFAPGVTDNAGKTAEKALQDAGFGAEVLAVYSGKVYVVKNAAIAEQLYNPLIQVGRLYSVADVMNGALVATDTAVRIDSTGTAVPVDLDVDDATLMEISRLGVVGDDGKPRGPLGLGLDDMKAIQAHFASLGRQATDIEIETLAQSWSEHCKHRIFAGALDEVEDGLFKHYIARATFEILDRPEKQGFCLSVFKDNAGAIRFDDDWMVSDKVETHNSPSALDPYGGAMTGVVGVNRDCLGFGLGAKPIANRYGFCLADPDNQTALYRDAGLTNALPSAEAIDHGVVEGIEAGGNQSGIPTCQGFFAYDDRFRGKPLVFAGTVGLLPMRVPTANGDDRLAHEKTAHVGDHIIVVGGAVGQDGIHGATFSSVALDSDSPATAVQIGDPITQKRLSDVLIKELRDQGLYSAITDNGAGGLSSSIGEMAEGPGGAIVHLDRSPLKYPGLSPWEIWISESQERMTLAVPPRHVDAVLAAFRQRDVLAADIGEFTNDGVLSLMWQGEALGQLTMAFLHDGAPRKIMSSKQPEAPVVTGTSFSFDEAAAALLASRTLGGRPDVARLYDHEVQATSVIKPLQGSGRVRGDATVIAPVPTSVKAVGMSHAVYPWLMEQEPHVAATLAVDTAVRNLVAVGVDPDQIALQDNFCWCSAEEPERLWQLKHAVRGCYDAAVHFGAPYISGKDSMFNDFKGFDADGNPMKVSALPTLLISSIGIVNDAVHCQTMDFKETGDTLYLVGTPSEPVGGSLLSAELGQIWQAPSSHALTDLTTLRAVHQLLADGKLASVTSLGQGGLFHALMRSAKAGGLGFDVDLPMSQLWGEVGGQFLLSVDPSVADAVEQALPMAKAIGQVAPASLTRFGAGMEISQ